MLIRQRVRGKRQDNVIAAAEPEGPQLAGRGTAGGKR
jgi:hypothetical protein